MKVNSVSVAKQPVGCERDCSVKIKNMDRSIIQHDTTEEGTAPIGIGLIGSGTTIPHHPINTPIEQHAEAA